VIRVGDVEVSRIEELVLRMPVALLPEWDKAAALEQQAWLVPDFYLPERDRIMISIHSWLLKTRRHVILIDTCGGNAKPRPTFKALDRIDTPYLHRLAEAGVTPVDVNYVVCTHLHVDHVGWNTHLVDGRWVPTFPNAVYILPRREIEQFSGVAESSPEHQIHLDSIQPILDAGQARIVEGDENLDEGIDLMPTPGHSPGHTAVRLRSRGEEALFAGDVLHHPIQIYQPRWNSRSCFDAEGARRTRLQILEHCARTGSLVLPTHFASPHYGRVVPREGGYAFVPPLVGADRL
jgi:glyoxylase-like metal-dependent hydrolase (beta-lactamase superfamily II)